MLKFSKRTLVYSVVSLQCLLILCLYIWQKGHELPFVSRKMLDISKSPVDSVLKEDETMTDETLKLNQQPSVLSSNEQQPPALPTSKTTVILKEQREQVLGKSAGNWTDSYRSQPNMNGIDMEINKVTDDYSYCPRTTPLLGPYPYLEETKSPCWWDGDVLRCLPYFFIVGFSKCGTSDLFFKVTRHPDVHHTRSKEKHWFDYQRFTDNNRFIQNYTNMFDETTKFIQEDLKKNGRSKIVTGDGTPCYAWGSLNWPCYEGNEAALTEPLITNANMIYQLNPNTKVIMVLREPVKRLQSRMLTYVHQKLHPAYTKPTAESFYNHVVEGIAKYKDCFQHWTHRECAYNGTLFAEVKLRLAEGMYSIYLRDWLQVFPKDQILILRFEDYATDSAKILREVFSFLDLAPLKESEFHRIVTTSVTNKGKHYDLDVWSNKTTEILQDFYRPFVKDLAELMGDTRFAWHY